MRRNQTSFVSKWKWLSHGGRPVKAGSAMEAETKALEELVEAVKNVVICGGGMVQQYWYCETMAHLSDGTSTKLSWEGLDGDCIIGITDRL